MKKRSLLFAALALCCGVALAASVAELPVPLYPLKTGSAAIKAGEPVGVVAGKVAALPAAGGAVALAVESASSNSVVTVKAGYFLLPAATNLAETAIGTTVHWDGGRVVADGTTSNALGRLLFLEDGRACVNIGL